MSAYKRVAKTTAFYFVAVCLIVIVSVVAALLLRAAYDLIFSSYDSGLNIGELFVVAAAYALFAVVFGATPAIAASVVMSMCVLHFAALRQNRIMRSIVGAVLGWVSTVLYLFAVSSISYGVPDYSEILRMAALALIGGVAGGIVGSLRPPKEAARAA